MKLETLAIHAGALNDETFGSVVNPLIFSTTFERDSEGGFPQGRDVYSRASNPNRRALEQKIAALENGTQAFCFASGQAATLSIFHSLLEPNSHVILPDDIYYGTRVLLSDVYKNWGVRFSTVDFTDLQAVESAIEPQTKLLWLESPSNPSLKITDIAAVSAIAQKHNILTACDNTWATPYFSKPLEMGIDIVMHSSTKYFGGHSDLLGGCVVLNAENEMAAKIRNFQVLGGGVPSAFDTWLLFRSLSTFPIRMRVHGENALKLAEYFSQNMDIEQVMYPGLMSDKYHDVAKKQMKNGFGGMLSICIRGDEKRTLKLASNLKLVKHATSLGGVETLVDHRYSAEGVHSTSPKNLLRVSAGIENIEDIIADFEAAFKSL
jgi:cystathionine gamma-synthase